jgi:hypothetical protein
MGWSRIVTLRRVVRAGKREKVEKRRKGRYIRE